jgi:predicted acylesterase/phospholipase RssA
MSGSVRRDPRCEYTSPNTRSLSNVHLASLRAIVAVSSANVSRCQIFRTYPSRQTNINCTLVEALCASIAAPPLFDPIPIGSRLRQQSFIGGALGYYNPTRELLKEARTVYGDEQRIALVLSLGSGLPPTLSLDSATLLSAGIEDLVKYIATDCERVARELSNQLVEVDAYIRLNVTRGLEDIVFNDWSHMGLIEDHTKTYLETASVAQTIARASEDIIRQVGVITLGQISMSSFLLLKLFH